MPRRVYLLGVGLALVALALAFTDWALSLKPGLTEANARRVRPGMTLGEVEALLGGPADTAQRADKCGGDWLREWRCPRGEVYVLSGPDGRVMQAVFQPQPTGPQSPLARLRAWLGW
jgi:hypothetical protein